VAAPYGVAWLLTASGPAAVYTALAGLLLAQALAVAVLGEETRNRSLEEIQAAGQA